MNTNATPDPHETLRDAITKAYIEAGSPSYRHLENMMTRMTRQYNPAAVSTSTLWRVITGRFTRPPRREVLSLLLEALGSSGERKTEVRLAHDAAATRSVLGIEALPAEAEDLVSQRPQDDDVREPQPGTSPADLIECETCSAMVKNMDRHLAWHWSIQQQPGRVGLHAVPPETRGSAG